jgi:hypothetical protein
MVSGAYLREQAEILDLMSRGTFDLGIARRLREMVSEFQTRAAKEEQECASSEAATTHRGRAVWMSSS